MKEDPLRQSVPVRGRLKDGPLVNTTMSPSKFGFMQSGTNTQRKSQVRELPATRIICI
jgi:hypothetical protein